MRWFIPAICLLAASPCSAFAQEEGECIVRILRDDGSDWAALDAAASEIIDRLRSDDIETRADAAADLRTLGPEVLPVIAAAARRELDVDVKVHLEMAARDLKRQLALQQQMQSRLPAAALFDVRARNVPLRTIAERLTEAGSYPIELEEGLGGKKVTVSLKEASLFEILQEVCRRHDGLFFSPYGASATEGIRIRDGKSPEAPAAWMARGPFLLVLDKCVGPYTFNLRVHWLSSTRVKPLRMKWVLDEMTGSDGASYASGIGKSVTSPGAGSAGMVASQVTARLSGDPPAGMKKYSVVGGRLDLTFPERLDRVVFSEPAMAQGGTETARGWTVELQSYSFSSGRGRFTLGVTRDDQPRPWPNLDRNLRWEAHVIDAGGDAHPCVFTKASWSLQWLLRSGEFSAPADGTMKDLQIFMLVGEETQSVEFKFRDVPIE